MNSKTRIALAGAACIMGCAFASAASPGVSAEGSSAAADISVAGPPPSPAYVWMTGHWNSEGGQWKWIPAHWELPPSRSAMWVGGHWAPQGGNWVWINGMWNVSDAPQSQASPPQPPGQGAQVNGQAVPMPSTAAPYISGQYAPGGVERAIDQPPVTTDYGPAQYDTNYAYDAAYPGYYWTYDPWYWGGYPWGLVGWGPGFVGGYGWGGYWHGGYWHGYGPGHGDYHGRGSGSYGGFSGRGSAGHFGGGSHR